ncbi:MAG: haloacid dehalogenase-like hydrolase, partial [Solobacterium sp.]|nr:haloacid dehalogenase-like hydrolase [Solobacterium sp.]
MNKIALIYDFDKTLSPRDMQEFHLIPSLGYDDPQEFWDKCKNETDKYNMDSILSYMLMIKKDNPDLTYDDLKREGKYLELFKGVDTWFERINRYGKRRGIEV